jgi:hypothetical protein
MHREDVQRRIHDGTTVERDDSALNFERADDSRREIQSIRATIGEERTLEREAIALTRDVHGPAELDGRFLRPQPNILTDRNVNVAHGHIAFELIEPRRAPAHERLGGTE